MGWAVNLVGATNFPVQSPIMAVAAPPNICWRSKESRSWEPQGLCCPDRALTARPWPAILCSSFLSVSVPQALPWSGLTASPGVPVLLTQPSPGCSGAMAEDGVPAWSSCTSAGWKGGKREFPEALQVVWVP